MDILLSDPFFSTRYEPFVLASMTVQGPEYLAANLLGLSAGAISSGFKDLTLTRSPTWNVRSRWCWSYLILFSREAFSMA
jgi:hypothetical protein